MRFFSPLLILAALLTVACGGAAVFPEVFSQERADGKIPVSIELIKKQTRKEIDGMPEKLATAERWREIEADYNDCRLSSARKTKSAADKIFADCMSRMGYVYMLRLDAEQLHDEIAAEGRAKYAAEKKAAEEVRLAAEKKAEEKRVADVLIRLGEQGNVAETQALLDAGANPDATRDDGTTALMAAAVKGYPEVAKALLAAGANPNAARDDGFTVLMWATQEGRPEIAKMLLAAGANPNAARDSGWTALAAATLKRYPEIAKMLLAAGANPNVVTDNGSTALMSAAENGYPEVAKVLIVAGANPNAYHNDGWTALILAAKNGYPEVVKMLLDAEANPNMAKKYDGETALMLAAEKGNPEVVEMLLAAGANPNAGEIANWTALMYAARAGYLENVKILLATGANPNADSRNGFTALMLAAKEDHVEVVKILLAAGVNLNVKNFLGQTALIMAAGEGHAEIIKVLYVAGANLSATTHDGSTALAYAAIDGHPEAVKMLLAAGANPNATDIDGLTALMLTENPDVAKILLDCGANPNQKADKGYSAYSSAELNPAMQDILHYYVAAQNKWRVSSCKGRWPLYVESSIGESVATAPPPNETNIAEVVFESAWRSIVVIRQGKKQGSGVIVRPNVVATNCHVVDSYGRIVIYKHDNRRATTDTTFNAVIRHQDNDRDFCLLNVAGLQGKPAKVRRYDTLKIGEDVYAVGSPKGLDLSLSSGIISQLRQAANNRSIQTDAAISPGSSGGGLFDSDGNMVGILTRKIADEKVEGIGFAIPAELILNL